MHSRSGTQLFFAPRLVSELASEGASGRLFSQTQINQNATRFGPICEGTVRFNLIETRIASCLFVGSSRKLASRSKFDQNLANFLPT